MIFFANPKAENIFLKEEILEAVAKVFESDRYILGDEVSFFESEFARYIGVNHCRGVGTGTDALIIALKSLGVGCGDEVIVPSHTAVATVSAVCQVGAIPVFVDVEKKYYTICPVKVKKAISEKTKAVIAVHLYGQCSKLLELSKISQEYKLFLIEDCAQAIGSYWEDKHVGSFGDVGCFSFFPTKNLGAIGDGGALVTNNPDLVKKITQIRQYGWDNKRISQVVGMNSRLDEMQAAILRVKLKHLDHSLLQRHKIASFYTSELSKEEVITPSIRNQTKHSFHLYVIQVKARDKLLAELKRQEIFAGIHYEVPVHRMPAYEGFVKKSSDLTDTESLVDNIISLPIYPGLKEEELNHIVRSLKKN